MTVSRIDVTCDDAWQPQIHIREGDQNSLSDIREVDHTGADLHGVHIVNDRLLDSGYFIIFELPIAVADSPKELAEMTGRTKGTVMTQISKKRPGWFRVKIEEDE